MPSTETTFAAIPVRVGRKIYVFGGTRSSHPFGSNQAWEYDASTASWSQLSDMTQPKAEPTVAKLNDTHLWITGG